MVGSVSGARVGEGVSGSAIGEGGCEVGLGSDVVGAGVGFGAAGVASGDSAGMEGATTSSSSTDDYPPSNTLRRGNGGGVESILRPRSATLYRNIYTLSVLHNAAHNTCRTLIEYHQYIHIPFYTVQPFGEDRVAAKCRTKRVNQVQ